MFSLWAYLESLSLQQFLFINCYDSEPDKHKGWTANWMKRRRRRQRRRRTLFSSTCYRSLCGRSKSIKPVYSYRQLQTTSIETHQTLILVTKSRVLSMYTPFRMSHSLSTRLSICFDLTSVVCSRHCTHRTWQPWFNNCFVRWNNVDPTLKLDDTSLNIIPIQFEMSMFTVCKIWVLCIYKFSDNIHFGESAAVAQWACGLCEASTVHLYCKAVYSCPVMPRWEINRFIYLLILDPCRH